MALSPSLSPTVQELQTRIVGWDQHMAKLKSAGIEYFSDAIVRLLLKDGKLATPNIFWQRVNVETCRLSRAGFDAVFVGYQRLHMTRLDAIYNAYSKSDLKTRVRIMAFLQTDVITADGHEVHTLPGADSPLARELSMETDGLAESTRIHWNRHNLLHSSLSNGLYWSNSATWGHRC